METVILAVHIMLALGLVVVILIQRTDNDGMGGMGGGGGGMSGMLTGRAKANILTRTTAILATLFICTSLTLAYMSSRSSGGSSIADKVSTVPAQPGQAVGDAPASPAAVPVAE